MRYLQHSMDEGTRHGELAAELLRSNTVLCAGRAARTSQAVLQIMNAATNERIMADLSFIRSGAVILLSAAVSLFSEIYCKCFDVRKNKLRVLAIYVCNFFSCKYASNSRSLGDYIGRGWGRRWIQQ